MVNAKTIYINRHITPKDKHPISNIVGCRKISDYQRGEFKWMIYTRLEIISDVVSEKARSGKIPIPHRKYRYHIGFFRYHIGNTITTSVFSDTTSVFPMWYRNFSATCLSDTTSEIISNRVSPDHDLKSVCRFENLKSSVEILSEKKVDFL